MLTHIHKAIASIPSAAETGCEAQSLGGEDPGFKVVFDYLVS